MLRPSPARRLLARIPGWWRRWPSLIVVGGLSILIAALQPYNNGLPIRSDGVGYHAWTYALISGRLDFGWHSDAARGELWLYRVGTDRQFWANKYPPGLALVRFPFMFPFVDRSRPDAITVGEHAVAVILGVAALLAIVALVLDCCRRLGASRANSHLAVLAITFGTGLFHYATYDACFSHIFSGLFVAVLMWLSVRAVCAGDGRLPAAATVGTVALLILLRNTNGLFVLFWAAFFLAWVGRTTPRAGRALLWNALVIAAGLAVGVGVQLAVNSHAHGRMTLSSYGTEAFLWHRPMMASVLVSYERGLFLYYPVLAVALGVGLWARRTRGATLALAAGIAAYAGLYGYWHSWHLGAGFGHRGFVEFMPLAVPVFAVGLDALGRRPRQLVVALTGACVFVTVSLMGGYWCDIGMFDDVTEDVYQSRVYRIDSVVRMWRYVHVE